MESSNRTYCYLHMREKLIKGSDENVECKGGRWDGISIDRGMTYHEFVA